MEKNIFPLIEQYEPLRIEGGGKDGKKIAPRGIEKWCIVANAAKA